MINVPKKLTCEADFIEVDAVWYNHEGPDAFRSGLFSCEITSGLLIFWFRAECSYSSTRLEINRVASPNQAVTRTVTQTQILAFLQDAKRWRRLAYLC